jgi:hypothetical protein
MSIDAIKRVLTLHITQNRGWSGMHTETLDPEHQRVRQRIASGIH